MGIRYKIPPYFLLLVFWFFLISPSLVKILDQSTGDTVVIFSLSEEENKQGKGTEKELKDFFMDGSVSFVIISPKAATLEVTIYNKYYSASGIEVPFPPPKYII